MTDDTGITYETLKMRTRFQVIGWLLIGFGLFAATLAVNGLEFPVEKSSSCKNIVEYQNIGILLSYASIAFSLIATFKTKHYLPAISIVTNSLLFAFLSNYPLRNALFLDQAHSLDCDVEYMREKSGNMFIAPNWEYLTALIQLL